jgi:hypothetical protein
VTDQRGEGKETSFPDRYPPAAVEPELERQGRSGINSELASGLPGSASGLLRRRPHRPGRAHFGHPVPRLTASRSALLSATVALTRWLMTQGSSRVSRWQLRRPASPFATHRLPRAGFPAFGCYYEDATTALARFTGLLAFGPQYPLVLSAFAHPSC